jgi:hypothetical protein
MPSNQRTFRGCRAITAFGALLTTVTASEGFSAAMAPEGTALSEAPQSSPFFEPNVGQAAASVRFLSRGATQNLLVTDGGLWFRSSGDERVGLAFGGAAKLAPVGADRLPGVSNYHLGTGGGASQAPVPHFGRLVSPSLYPSVDLVAYAHERDVEYDLVVAPGGDPGQIRLRFPGAARVTLDRAGDLLIGTPSGTVRNGRPMAYQTSPRGMREPVTARYQLRGNGEIGIALGRYDRRRPLVIDPVLSSTKRIAGSGNEQVTDIAVDGSGNVYVTGFTEGRGFPTLNGYQTTIRGDVDAFVAKYNSSGTLIYSTFYGGNGEDVARAIAVDGTGRAYVVGATKSTNLAVVNAVQGNKPLGDCSFLLVLSAGGNSLVYASYLGGTTNSSIIDQDNRTVTVPPEVHASDVGVGMDGALWVTGETTSTTFPFAIRGFQTSFGGGNYDAFVMRVNPSNGSVTNFSYYGGPGIDRGRRLVRSSDQFLLGGDTYSSLNLGVLGSGGGSDVFVIGIYDSGFAYAGGKRFGGSGDESLRGLGVDGSRNVYISGETLSTNLPVTAGVGQSQHGMVGASAGYSDAFVAKLNGNLTTLMYATYLGGKGMEINGDIAVTSSGTAYVTGTSYSNNFPRVPSASVPSQGNVFVTQLNSAGGFSYSGLLGGSATDAGTAIAVSGSNLWIGGTSLSSSFPGAPAAVGSWDGLLTKMTLP